MKQQQAGFTLIELIAVIVVLGILAAVAVPRFVNLTSAAAQAAVDGVAGNLASASALNHAGNVAKDAGVDNSLVVITTTAGCTNAVAGNLLEGGLPSGYTVSGASSVAEGSTTTCTVTGEDSRTATFELYGVTN